MESEGKGAKRDDKERKWNEKSPWTQCDSIGVSHGPRSKSRRQVINSQPNGSTHDVVVARSPGTGDKVPHTAVGADGVGVGVGARYAVAVATAAAAEMWGR